MSQHYSDPAREADLHSLPDVEAFEMTAREVAERDEDLIDKYMQRPEFRLALMNLRTREAMFDAIIEEEGIKGGWYYWLCAAESDAIGPYATRQEAIAAAQKYAAGYRRGKETEDTGS